MKDHIELLNKAAVYADNFNVCVISQSKEHFDAAIAMAMSDHKKALSYKIDDNELIMYWSEDEGTSLPYAMRVDGVIDFAWNWLKSITYSNPPDTDGSCSKGWKVSTRQDFDSYENYYMFSVTAEWMVHSK